MNIFISGATGFIGNRLALRLADEGHTIHALYRSENKSDLIRHPNIRLFKGDILDLPSIDAAMSGCRQVYHTAAFTKVRERDHSRIYSLNILGTMNVIQSGITAGVEKFVVTSTAGVFGPSKDNHFIDENSARPDHYFIDYETSKAILEEILRIICKSGTSIVMVNPTRVYGPGLLSESNGVTRMIKSYLEGYWRFIPGNGKSIGNYVHVEDVVTGHILAMKIGLSGSNYILGGANISYNDFFTELSFLTGKKHLMIHVPFTFMLLLSKAMMLWTKISGKEPLITPPLVKKFVQHWKVSSSRAINELGFDPVSFTSGLKNTLEWLQKKSEK